MSISTREKIDVLQKFLKDYHNEIRSKHIDNIVALRIGKKNINGKPTNVYSIVFQVVKKINPDELDPKFVIPKKIQIDFPDGKKRFIKTDVEETGKFKFHFGIASEVKSKYSIHFGSVGLFVGDNLNRTYMLTNYHVVAESFISKRRFRYRRPLSQTKSDVRIIDRNGSDINGRFEEGLISHEIDAAFVELPIDPDPRLNILPDNSRIQGRVLVRPLPPSIKNKPVIIYSFYNPTGVNSVISDNSAVLYTDDEKIFFEDIIQIRPKVTQGGDSGGLVLNAKFAVLGIIVGGDNLCSYAIPFYKIDDFKNINIL
ncbi:hypothetical protein [Larkinella arboricola]